MSLLMDALRKAEEAKKQAEQGNSAGDKSSEPTAPAPIEPVAEPISSAEPESPKNFSPDLSVMLEFEEEPSPMPQALSPAADVPTLSDDLDKAIETVSLSLEANAHNTVKAAPLAESLESFPPAADATSKDDLESFLDDAESSSHGSEIELPLTGPVADDTQAMHEQESAGTIEYASASNMAEPKQAAAAPKVMQTATNTPPKRRAESITERTAQSRESAKSVFAAKRLNGNNKAYVYGGGGIAAAVVLALGYFMLSAGGSDNTFTIPDGGYVSANEASYSGSNTVDSGPVERAGAAVENDPALESADAIDQTGAVSTLGFTNPVLAVTEAVQGAPTSAPGLNVTSTLEVIPEPSVPDPLEVPTENQAPAGFTETVLTGTSAPVNNSAVAVQAREEIAPAQGDEFSLNAGGNDAIGDSGRTLITFSKKALTPVVSPQLNDAYSAYQAGNLDLAMTLYNQVLGRNPRNIDALLGKAAISSEQGENSQAMSLYSNVLTLNPSQAIARSGLLSLVPAGNSSDQERQLRRLMSDYPNVAPLAFALGNFYASQSRWTDAQQNYFNALSLAKAASATGALVSPDYAFNLAVSLDRLNQPKPASTYYQEALTLASQYPANFDLDVARSRIDKLLGSDAP